ncbi:propanediol utilization protein [Salipiger mangrovisoli]|uniref:Propanediol utilization protein n=1 Tax=Salipiger mangrovisoli TaxID=2865933 RepID=A0ABR9X526_9RHOB|nr:propanediol utilization protein [Salipiger mangrovisoli]MBE9638648.1 propanediol utilization protein [Salipiger mangrovisoli]
MSRAEVSVAGHFGEWLQGRLGPQGPVALVTVRCPALHVRVPGPDPLPFDERQLDAFACQLGIPVCAPGAARNFPLGGGAGGSTATLVALARAAGFAGGAARLAEACLVVEGASDPLMFPRPDTLLWASREGRVLGRFAPPPACAILGGFWGAPIPTDPDDSNFDDISDLAADWGEATETADLARCAALASASADRCRDRRDGADGPADPTPDLARDLGALGWLRAHTGSARGLVFSPGTLPRTGASVLAEAGLQGVINFGTGGT